MTGVTPRVPLIASPTYPVSSLSSLTAHVSGDSPASTSPAGTSMHILSIGARYCFCRSSSGPDDFSSTATMPTASTRDPSGLVVRSADSQSRVYPPSASSFNIMSDFMYLTLPSAEVYVVLRTQGGISNRGPAIITQASTHTLSTVSIWHPWPTDSVVSVRSFGLPQLLQFNRMITDQWLTSLNPCVRKGWCHGCEISLKSCSFQGWADRQPCH